MMVFQHPKPPQLYDESYPFACYILPRTVNKTGLFTVFQTTPSAKKASPWKQVAILPLQPKATSARKNYCSHGVPQK